jgi:hypothetical protein
VTIVSAEHLSVVGVPDVGGVILAGREDEITLPVVTHHCQGAGVSLEQDGPLTEAMIQKKRKRDGERGEK